MFARSLAFPSAMHLDQGTLDQPSLPWRFCSSVTMFTVSALCRGFLCGLNTTEVKGQEEFLKLLESRQDHNSRTRGLITGKICAVVFLSVSIGYATMTSN